MFCPNCGKQNDDRAAYCQGCGVTLQVAPGAASAGPVRYAGFWKRFAAVLIDAIVLAVGSGILASVTFGVGGIIAAFFGPWLYEAAMLSSKWRATLGKRALGIVVTRLDGSTISFARATGRHFAKYLSVFILFIGFIMAAFTAKKQALHDMIAETLVVNE